jgi:hypothetical protein
MDFGPGSFFYRYRWHAGIVAVLVGAAVLAVFTGITAEWFTIAAGSVVLVLLVVGISMFAGAVEVLRDTGAKIDKIAETAEKNRSILSELDQHARLSEAAKGVAFRDDDAQVLRDSVLDKLHQQDFDATGKMIDRICALAGYGQLADQLRAEAAAYRDATEQERINQVAERIERLFEGFRWAKASSEIERLIAAYPNSDKAGALRRELFDRKQHRKNELLKLWDDAVKRQDTDRSLEILRALDLYLTPNEGLALQEAARDVFRNKLHNLGVQFSLAVSEKRWAEAVETGAVIVRDFPNSRMAEEIREKWDILNRKVRQPATGSQTETAS